MAAKKKDFDAVEMSRRLRENTSRELSAMSREERRNCLNEAARKFRERVRARQAN
jgi:hypothetical protein